MSLPHVILTVLSTRSATGYDITKEFSGNIGYFWKASHQQVYRELNKMAEVGQVTCVIEPQDGKPDKKIYSITDDGREALEEWFHHCTVHPTVRDEFSAKLMACSVQSPSAFLEQLQELILESYRVINYYQEVEKNFYSNSSLLSKVERLERLTLRKNLLSRQAWLAWAEETIRELDDF